MASKQEEISELYKDTTKKIIANKDNWKDFLEAMGRLYKYPYPDQLMIYAQNPKATACAEVELWNKVLNRTLKSGANAIALLETSMGKTPMRYVFDIADTDIGRNGKNLTLWELNENNQKPVMEMLSKNYEIDNDTDISSNILMLSFSMAQDYIKDHPIDYNTFAKGSQLEGESEQYLAGAIEQAMAVSITYTLLNRMGIEADNYFNAEDFEPLLQLMSTENVSYLGTAVSEQTEQVLRDVERTIKDYEKETTHETDISQRGGISRPQPENGSKQADTTREIRQNEGNTPETAQQTPVQSPSTVGNPLATSDGNRQNSQQTTKINDEHPVQSVSTSQQGDPTTGMGSTHEQPASTSRGNSHGGTDFQLNQGETQEEYVQTSMFPSVAQQLTEITQRVEAENEKPKIEFKLSEQEILNELRQNGSGFVDGKLRIYDIFQQNITSEERLEAIKKEYGNGGHSTDFADGSRGFIDYSPSAGMVAWKTQTREETKVT